MVRVPCGQCIHCRKVNGLNWAVRIMAESSLHAENSFMTLTYSKEYVPDGLVKAHASEWVKRFREALDRTIGRRIRHYTVGEYGSKNMRPHFHSCIFGWYPSVEDTYEIGNRLYASHLVDKTWGMGRTSFDELNPATAAYVARYCLKKMTGSFSDEWYAHPETGEILPKECAVMSRRPGIGRAWFEKHSEEVFPHDKVWFSGGLVTPPSYYFELMKKVNPSMAEEVSRARAAKFDLAEWDRIVWTGVAEEVERSKFSNDKRHKEM